MTIKSIAIAGGSAPADFVFGGNCPLSPVTLGAGKSCSITVTFTPSALGSRTATLTVTHSASNSPQSVVLSGTGVAQVTLSASNLNFGTVAVGNVSTAKSVMLTNRKNTPLAFSGISSSGDFSIATNTCGASIGAGATCTISITFTPITTGSRAGTLTFNDNATNTPQTVSLTGTGSLPVTASPASLLFSSRTVGTTSSAQTVTLTNHLNTSVAVSAVVAGGDFALASNTCGSSLGAGFTCKIGVTFTPRVVGARSGTVTISYSAYGSPSLVTLTGTGNASGLISIAVTPANPSIAFGAAQQFIATGKFSGGSQDLTASVVWNSSAPGIAAISNAPGTQGMATGVAQGNSTITATLNSIGGLSTLTVAPPPLVSIAVNPPNGTVPVGRGMQFHATGTYADSSTKDVTPSVTWTSSVMNVATIGANTGMASAAATGQTTIQAAYNSIGSNQAALLVTPGFVFTGSLNTARENHTATLLTNGKVLIAGGFDGSNSASATAELYDPVAGTFSATGNLNTAREYQTATMLNDGKVLIVGGFDGTNSATASAELYDPVAGTFSPTGSLNIARGYHTATLLSNGKVLIAGGVDSTNSVSATAELYDPVAGTFSPTGSLNAAREYHTATPLNNGTVLIAGGFNGSVLASAELYDPTAGAFTTISNLNVAREYHTATLLNNGTILLAGGFNGSVLADAEMFDPVAGTFSPTGSLNTAREYHTATLLNNGTVLFAGGVNGSVSASAELYDPTTSSFSTTGNLNTAREYHTTTLLNNGMVLIAGGSESTNIATNSAELYEPGTLTPAGLVSISVSPAASAVPLGAAQRFTATGTFTDGTTQTLSSVTWSSSDATIAAITNDATNLGAADAMATGSATLSACAGSVCGPTTLAVTSPALVTIAVTPANGVLPVGQSVQFDALGTYTDSSTQDLTSSVAWSSGSPLVATINSTGLASGVGTGNSNISATLNGVTGSTTLTVNPAPIPLTITTQPANQTVTAGQTATFSVLASGTAPLSYQWQANGSPITGANSSSYTTPPTAMTDSGTAFQVVVSDPTDSTTSNAATLTVNASPVAPNITTPPASTIVTVGQSATFSVVASGTAPLSYQWQQNGSAISGAITASYTTPPTSMLDNGSTYNVIVSNPVGNTPSSAATLTVQVPPGITTQPANQTVNVGQVATFSVVASGTAPLSYQWQKNGQQSTARLSASYTTPATTTNDNGATFGVMVTNPAGNMPSNTAILTVQVPPSITTQPANQTVIAGQPATFSVVAAGTAPLSYQWQKNRSAISGAISASYTTPATVATDNGGTFSVMVSNTAGNTPSNSATLTVQSPPSITTQPANQTVIVGQVATFSVVASGTAPLTYQWQKNGTSISGATSASYTTQATVATDNGATFTVMVSNVAGNASSTSATLTVQVPPSITTQPANQTVNVGQVATFSVIASGTAPLTYQWQENGSTISGATSASYTTPPTTAADNASTFRVVVSNAAGNTPSGTASLTVQSPPSITTQPANVTVTAGQTANFSVAAAGTSPLSYQWQKNGANISGATSSSYTTPATKTSDNGASFVVNVTNPAGSMASGAAILTVNADTTPPTVSITSPISGSTVGGTISITATASDDIAVASVQLQVDGANSGAADTTSPYNFSLDTTMLTNANHTLTAVATDTSGNQATSAGVSITVANQVASSTPGYAGNGAGCPLSNDDKQTSDRVTQYHCPLPNSTISGNLLVLLLRYNTPAQTPSFTDNVGGNTYKLGVSCTDTTHGVVSAIYYVQGVRAGVNDIDVHLSSIQFVQMQPYEFFNAGALDQATCQSSSGTTVATPALNALTTSGDLVFQQAVVDSVQQISACTTGSQSNIAWTLRSAMIGDNYPSCVQYGVYNATASFAPTFTLGTSASFITAAAAFKPAVAGSAPPSGIRVVYVQHDDTEGEQDKTVQLETPITGNTLAVLFGSGCLDPSSTDCAYPTSATDGVNTYIQIGPTVTSHFGDGGDSAGNVWYAKGVTPGTYFTTWTMHPRSSGGNGNTMFLYDIANASSDPLDTNFGGAGNGLASNIGDQSTDGSGGNLTTITATPSQPNEVILITVGAGWNTFTGLTAPSGAQFLSSHYNTETNSSHCDLNGGWGLFYNGSSTSPQSWTWTQDASNFPGVGAWMSVGAAFH